MKGEPFEITSVPARAAGQPFGPALGSPGLESLRGLKGIEYRKAWNKLHREKMNEVSRNYRKRHPEVAHARWLVFKEKHPELGHIPDFLKKEYRGNGKGKKKYYGGFESAKCRGNRWDVIEDCMVMERKMTDRSLARELERSISAIQGRRFKLTKANK